MLVSSEMYETLELQFYLDSCACTESAAESWDSPHNPVWVYGVFSKLLIEQNTKMLKYTSWVTGLLLKWKKSCLLKWFFFSLLKARPRCIKYGLLSFFFHTPNQDMPSGTHIFFVVVAADYSMSKCRLCCWTVLAILRNHYDPVGFLKVGSGS